MATWLVEYFTQREVSARLAREPTDVRAARRTLTRRARQKREAAALLWSGGQTAEGLSLMRDAVLAYREAVEDAATGDTLAAKLVALGARASEAAQVEQSLSGLADRALPAFDDEITSEDGATFQQLGDLAATLDTAVADAVLFAGDVRARRFARVGLAALVAVGAVVALVFLLRPVPPAPATASAVFTDEPVYAASNAVDGDPTTEWLLPGASAGWLDVRVSPPRPIHRVWLTNGHNRAYIDRGVRAYRLEAYDGDRRVATAAGQFASLVAAPTPVAVRLVAPRVDRVRIVVLSWFDMGAALTDVRVE